MTTLLVLLMVLFVLFVAASAARLRKLQRAVTSQLEINLRLGGEVHQGLTALSGQSAAFGALLARNAGEVQEAIGRVRADADRVLEALRSLPAEP